MEPSAERIVRCPHCQHAMTILAAWAGTAVECPTCRRPVQIAGDRPLAEPPALAGRRSSIPRRISREVWLATLTASTVVAIGLAIAGVFFFLGARQASPSAAKPAAASSPPTPKENDDRLIALAVELINADYTFNGDNTPLTEDDVRPLLTGRRVMRATQGTEFAWSIRLWLDAANVAGPLEFICLNHSMPNSSAMACSEAAQEWHSRTSHAFPAWFVEHGQGVLLRVREKQVQSPGDERLSGRWEVFEKHNGYVFHAVRTEMPPQASGMAEHMSGVVLTVTPAAAGSDAK